MSDGHKLVKLMRQAGKTPQNEIVDIVVGTMVSVNPPSVNVDGKIIPSQFVFMSPLCYPYQIQRETEIESGHVHDIKDTYTGGGSSSPTSHKHNLDIVIWEGLKPGDNVLMLKVGKGQKYYVLHKQGGFR